MPKKMSAQILGYTASWDYSLAPPKHNIKQVSDTENTSIKAVSQVHVISTQIILV